MARVLVIIPAYNESESIGDVLAALKREAPECDVVVVNDGSPDQTGEIVRAAGTADLIRLPYNLGIGAAMLAAAVAAIAFTFYFIDQERQRDLQAWQVRLGIVADSRSAAVNEWVEQNFAIMRELTENASLQLYMTELAMAEGDRSDVTDEPAQAGYLRNLLVATADRTGFKPPPAAGEIAANIEGRCRGNWPCRCRRPLPGRHPRNCRR